MITPKQAARIRWEIKRGTKSVSANRRAKLAEYEAANNGQQSPAETRGEGGGDNPGKAPQGEDHPSPPGSPPPADPSDLPDPPAPEAPPFVRDAPIDAGSSSSSSSGKAGDWREKWRKEIHFADDGRQMLCEMLGGSAVEALGAMCDEMKKAGIQPKVDPRKLMGLYVLALDEVLPARARMSPKVGAVVATTVVVGQRYYYAKEIAEALKNDPEHQEWIRKQAERERTEQAQRAAHDAEAKAGTDAGAKAATPSVQYAEAPAPPSEPAVNGTAIIRRPEPRRIPLADDPEALF